eukprot:CAMPEP_0118916678 /NCGR_PEP_ID=MMETSP1166-20130328/16627_1 /TAXON_ID=1104430 /ORGANISM="Chrysoreinhardia sp, Strain CCMP3193" /LENGTH=145 /DNA_ID=CAMNT_0006856585 /DNA_START=79 /DNA_END=513 /DNA_ORIENTATION=-
MRLWVFVVVATTASRSFLLGGVSRSLVARELRENVRIHEETVAFSERTWGRLAPPMTRDATVTRTVVRGLVGREVCAAIVDEARAAKRWSSRFTMSGANVREVHASELPRTKEVVLKLWPKLASMTGCDYIYDALVLRYDAQFSK